MSGNSLDYLVTFFGIVNKFSSEPRKSSSSSAGVSARVLGWAENGWENTREAWGEKVNQVS